MPPLSLAVAASAVFGAAANYPILSHKFQADPAPVVGTDGRLYVHASHDKDDPHGFDMEDYTCFSTDDMVNWLDHGECFSPKASANQIAWAPQAVQYNGRFYLYYGARDGQDQSKSAGVWMTSGPTPLGPWEAPWQITGPETTGGDPTAFVDPQDPSQHRFGQAPGAQSAKLSADMRSVPDPDELGITFGANPSGVHEYYFEAPWYTKVGGRYIFAFMGTGFENPDFRLGGPKDSFAMYGHNILYMTCDALPTRENPTGNCGPVKVLMWSPPDSRNNGDTNNQPGIIEYPPGSGKWYMTYHGDFVDFMDTGSANYRRSSGIDRVYWDGDHFKVFTATRSWTRQLKYVNPYTTNQAASMSDQGCECNGVLKYRSGCDGCGICTLPTGDGRRFVGCFDRLRDFIKVTGVDFGSGSSSITLRAASPLDGAVVEVRLNTFHGSVACTVNIPNTGGWEAWADASEPCHIQGVHDIYLMYGGHNGFNLDTWHFSGGSPSGVIPPAVARHVQLRTPDGRSVGVDDSGLVSAGASHGDFVLYDNEDGTWAIQSTYNKKYVACNPGKGGQLFAQSDQVITWERFSLFATPPPDGTQGDVRELGTAYTIQATTDGTFVAATPALKSGCSDPRKCPGGPAQFFVKDQGKAVLHLMQGESNATIFA